MLFGTVFRVESYFSDTVLSLKHGFLFFFKFVVIWSILQMESCKLNLVDMNLSF